MQQERFMYGDEAALLEEPAPVESVLLVGFQGQTKLLTGTHEALWNEFFNGDGGFGCNGVWPIGWHLWIPQPLLTTDITKANVTEGTADWIKRNGN